MQSAKTFSRLRVVRPAAKPLLWPAPARAKLESWVNRHGFNSTSYVLLEGPKQYFTSPRVDGFLAYQVRAGAAVIGGDPVCPRLQAPELIRDFVAAMARCPVGAYQVSPEMRGAFREAGFKDIQIGNYDQMIREAGMQPGVDGRAQVVLAGWSLGAGYSVLVATDPDVGKRTDRVVAISLPVFNELAWKPMDALIYITHGTPREKVFDARQFIAKLDPVPIVILNATDDDTSPSHEAQSLFEHAPGPKHLYMVKASGHHFEGGEAEFYRALDQGLVFNHP